MINVKIRVRHSLIHAMIRGEIEWYVLQFVCLFWPNLDRLKIMKYLAVSSCKIGLKNIKYNEN